MDEDQEKLAKLGLVLKYHGDRSIAAANTIEQAVAALERRADALSNQAGALTRGVVEGVKTQAGEAIRRDASQAFDPVRAAIGDAARNLSEAAQTMQAEREAMHRTMRRWQVLGLGGLLIGSLLTVAMSAYAVWSSRKEVARLKVESETLQVVNRSDVMICGERLCARIDKKGKQYGEYVPVTLR